MSPELIERLREYEKGNRAKRITAADPTFFDSRTGEPIIWYYRNKSGNIELFDLMGFHPETGEELLPISKDIVEQWKKRQLSNNEPPRRIDDPEKYSFFDPLTGEPRAWYWRSENGDYEFYDNRGFHPRTGEPLLVITREVNAKWKQEMEEAKQRQLRRQREKQEQTERENQKRLKIKKKTGKRPPYAINWQRTQEIRRGKDPEFYMSS